MVLDLRWVSPEYRFGLARWFAVSAACLAFWAGACTKPEDGEPSDAGLPPGAATDASTAFPGDAATPDAGGGAHLASCLPTATLKPGKSTFTLQRDGAERAVNVYTPSSYDGTKPLPLVVDFHGLHLGAKVYESVSKWDESVDQNQYIVAMPQGIQNAWNIGPCCTESRAVDDVQYARELVGKIAADGCVDTSRIYATGYSNGGGMSFAIACGAADLFAAVAPAAFDLLEEMDCRPARPLSVFIFRGTADPIVPYAGGPSTPPTIGYSLSEIHFLGAQRTFERWAELNGCTEMPAETSDGCITYTQCKAGVKVSLCSKQGGSHDPSPPEAAWPMLKEFVLP